MKERPSENFHFSEKVLLTNCAYRSFVNAFTNEIQSEPGPSGEAEYLPTKWALEKL